MNTQLPVDETQFLKTLETYILSQPVNSQSRRIYFLHCFQNNAKIFVRLACRGDTTLYEELSDEYKKGVLKKSLNEVFQFYTNQYLQNIVEPSRVHLN